MKKTWSYVFFLSIVFISCKKTTPNSDNLSGETKSITEERKIKIVNQWAKSYKLRHPDLTIEEYAGLHQDEILKRYDSFEDWYQQISRIKQKLSNKNNQNLRQTDFRCTLKTPDIDFGVQMTVPSYLPLLGTWEAYGIEYPQCEKAGASLTCVAKLLSGTIDQSDQSFLNDCEMENGWMLPCVSYPMSDVIIKGFMEEHFWACLGT